MTPRIEYVVAAPRRSSSWCSASRRSCASFVTISCGARPDEAESLARAALACPHLDVRGLMCIAAQGPADAARGGFRLLADTARELELAELSMGMTDDLEVAIQEGATMVRVGRGLFGPRQSPPGLRE